MTLQVVITGTTCGLNCWHAVEDICRCSCGGANHGCLRGSDGVQPTRTCKMQGVMRELAGVGEGVCEEAQRLNEESGQPFRYSHMGADPMFAGVLAKVKPATADQIAKWPELAAYRQPDVPVWRQTRPYLLWIRK